MTQYTPNSAIRAFRWDQVGGDTILITESFKSNNAQGNGYGVMYSYADRVEPADRWAIVAYIRALQQSQLGAQISAR